MVVGAGNVPLFLNSIRSIQRLRAGDIFGAYNYVSEADFFQFQELTRGIQDLAKLEVRPNKHWLRTGSLYEANNAALEFALGRYDFISFTQADMQMMWWDEAILERTLEIVDDLECKDWVSFYTQIPIIGKHTNPYEQWTRNAKLKVYESVGHVDVCLLPLIRGLNRGFRFEGSENEMSITAVNRGARLILHPFTFLGAIPFPPTVRDGLVHRLSFQRTKMDPILKVAAGFNPDFGKPELHPISMEKTVHPNGWTSLYPYWPSDTLSENWLLRRLEAVRACRLPLTAAIDRSGKVVSWPGLRFVPGWRVFLLSFQTLFFRELRIKFFAGMKQVGQFATSFFRA